MSTGGTHSNISNDHASHPANELPMQQQKPPVLLSPPVLPRQRSFLHVKGGVREGERMRTASGKRGIREPAGGDEGPGLVEDGGGVVKAGDVPLRDEHGEVGGDGPRAAADIGDGHVGPQVWDEVGGGVGGGAPGVRAQHRFVVAVGVNGGLLRLGYVQLYISW